MCPKSNSPMKLLYYFWFAIIRESTKFCNSWHSFFLVYIVNLRIVFKLNILTSKMNSFENCITL